jgi:alkylated DNA repair dioxygenase AlkB
LPLDGAVPDVPGLVYVPDYVSFAEEQRLLHAVDSERWRTDWQRRRQVYGVAYSGPQAGARLGPLPEWLSWLVDRLRADGWLEAPVVNAVINEYLPGQGIGPHVDHLAFGPQVAAVSLGGATLLDLTSSPGPAARKVSLDVQPRSLWVLGGEARTHWLHSIAPRHSDVVGGAKRPRARRISITLRTH